MLVAQDLQRIWAREVCSGAWEWLTSLPPDAPAQVLWERCPRGDWLLWALAWIEIDRRQLGSVFCDLLGAFYAAAPSRVSDRQRQDLAHLRTWS